MATQLSIGAVLAAYDWAIVDATEQAVSAMLEIEPDLDRLATLIDKARPMARPFCQCESPVCPRPHVPKDMTDDELLRRLRLSAI